MAHRPQNSSRCARCHQRLDLCLCGDIVALETRTRLAVVMHQRERQKTTATSPLALVALAQSELYIHGERDSQLDLRHLGDGNRRVLVLFPADDARVLSSALVEEDPRPITLVVPDGNWRQASRAARRIPGLVDAPRVVLPAGGETAWGIRRETREGGLATFEAIARAFGILEGPEVQMELEALFQRMVEQQRSLMPYVDGRGRQARAPEPDQPALEVLMDDDDLVVINKPSGRLVHRGSGTEERPLLQQLRDQIGLRLYPVHRLDRSTSGALLFAKSSEAARTLKARWEQATEKRYLALCRGHDPELTWVDHPLTRDPENGNAERVPAVTEFRYLAHSGRYGLYEARPLTGRSHQIRRHLKHVSHPIIGDVRYGKGEHNRHFREKYDLHRLALHCYALRFPHPRSAGLIEVFAPLPPDLLAVFEALGLVGALPARGS